MKKTIFIAIRHAAYWSAALCILIAPGAMAGIPAAMPEARLVSIDEPAHSSGVRIGDVLRRRVTLDLQPPYQISTESYPAKGTVRDGIELVSVATETRNAGRATRYRIDLSYQVFTHHRTPTVMQLPVESLAITGGAKALRIEIPAWRFWLSPLVDADIRTARANLQPQYAPDRIALDGHRYRLVFFAVLLAGTLIAAVYVNADRRWLPFMGGAFAQAYRRVRRLGSADGDDKRALMHLHAAFNQVYGRNLFARDVDDFLARHAAFGRLRQEIEAFFQRSGEALFAAPPRDRDGFVRELATLSKALRDCERGVR